MGNESSDTCLSKQAYDRMHLHLHIFSVSVRLVWVRLFLSQRHLDRKRLACLTCLHRRMDVAHGVCLPVSTKFRCSTKAKHMVSL